MKNQSLFRRATFALEGLRAAWRNEKSVRTHVFVIVVAFIALSFFDPRPLWWIAFLLAAGFMLVVELINTAVEKLADHLHPDIHPDIKIVKDVLAAAVFISCCIAGTVVLIFLWIRI